MRSTAVALALSVACLACGGSGAGRAPGAVGAEEEGGESAGADDSLFERLGGLDFVRALVDELVLRLAADGRINHLLADVDIAALKERLAAGICAHAGGPCVREGEVSAEALASRELTEADFEAMLENLEASLESRGAPPEASRELLERAAAMKSDIVTR